MSRQGWQHSASAAVEASFLADTIWPRLDGPHQVLMRLEQGPMAGIPFTCMPPSSSRFQPQEFRVLLHRRLWQPLSLSSSICRSGRSLDSRGHHGATCSVAWVLGRRGFVLESATARVCREADGRVTANVRVQEMDLPSLRQVDNDRPEVVVDGFHDRRAQLAIDTTMVSPIRRDGTARRQCATTNGVALVQAKRRKERTYPELAGAMERWGEGGLRRPAVSWVPSQKPKPDVSPRWCESPQCSLGCADGAFSWRARLLVLSPCHCWTADVGFSGRRHSNDVGGDR